MINIQAELQAMRDRISLELTKEETEIILRYYERWGRLKTVNHFENLTSIELTKILKKAGKL